MIRHNETSSLGYYDSDDVTKTTQRRFQWSRLRSEESGGIDGELSCAYSLSSSAAWVHRWTAYFYAASRWTGWSQYSDDPEKIRSPFLPGLGYSDEEENVVSHEIQDTGTRIRWISAATSTATQEKWIRTGRTHAVIAQVSATLQTRTDLCRDPSTISYGWWWCKMSSLRLNRYFNGRFVLEQRPWPIREKYRTDAITIGRLAKYLEHVMSDGFRCDDTCSFSSVLLLSTRLLNPSYCNRKLNWHRVFNWNWSVVETSDSKKEQSTMSGP